MKALIHEACGEIAFVFIKVPNAGDVVSSEDVFYPSGKILPKKGDKMRCDSCGYEVKNTNLDSQYLKDYEK